MFNVAYTEGTGWSEMLTRLEDLLHLSHEEKQTFYKRIILESLDFLESLDNTKSDIAMIYLDKIKPLTSFFVKEAMIAVFMNTNAEDFFHALCSKMQREKFELDPKMAAKISISCVQWKRDEKMFLTLLNQIHCDFTSVDVNEETILHACEESDFSSSTLTKLLKRPEGPQMFTSKNWKGRTPVQCRASYINTPNSKDAEQSHHTVHRQRCSCFATASEPGTLLQRQRRRASLCHLSHSGDLSLFDSFFWRRLTSNVRTPLESPQGRVVKIRK